MQQQQRAGRTALLKQRVSMAPVRSFSSASAVRLTSVQLMSEQGEYESRVVLLLDYAAKSAYTRVR